MLAAHALDSRRGTKGLEYQSYVLLGQRAYKSFKPWMETKDGNQRNRLHEVDKRDLLKYAGTDALLEWKICQLQMKKLGITGR